MLIDPLKKYLVYSQLHFTRNPITHHVSPASSTLTNRETLKYALEVYTPQNSQSPNFSKLTTLEAREKPPVPPFLTSEGVTFMVNSPKMGLLDTQLSSVPPAFGQQAISVVSTLTSPYYVVENTTGGVPEVNTSIRRPNTWCYKGGLSRTHFDMYRNTFFTEYLQESRSFLTFSPSTKLISARQQEYLYFLLNFSPLPEEVRVRILVTYSDGSTEILTKQSISNLITNQVLCIPVGVSALELSGTIESYQVWLSDHTNRRLSEVRTYNIDPAQYSTESFVLFCNSLGTYDTLRFTGQRTSTIRAEREVYNSADYEGGRVRILSSNISQDYMLNTGYMSSSSDVYSRYLVELMFSSDMYLATAAAYIPVILNQDEYIASQTNLRELPNFEFTFQEALVSDSYSLLPERAVVTPDTVYVPIDLFYLLRPDGYRSGYIKGARLKQVYSATLEDVLPLRIKPNTEGDPDFIPAQYVDAIAGTTPNPSPAITRLGTFKRATCTGITVPGYATIIITAGSFGGETAQDALQLAEAEYTRTNTQEYADMYGVCHEGPWIYEQVVPAGYAFFRINIINSSYVANGICKFSENFQEAKGNTWFIGTLPMASDTDVYPAGKWDILLPTNYGITIPWRFSIYSRATRVRIFVNGELASDNVSPPRNDHGVAEIFVPHAAIPSGAKVYVQID